MNGQKGPTIVELIFAAGSVATVVGMICLLVYAAINFKFW